MFLFQQNLRLRSAGARRAAASSNPTILSTILRRMAALLLAILLTPATQSAAEPSFATRVEADFGDSPFFFSTGDWRSKSGRQWSYLRSAERKIAANFLIEDNDVPVSILFTAESYVDTPGRSLYLRLLVDGQPMAPANVVLTRGASNVQAAQSFEFTGIYDEGIHTVEAQLMADPGGTGFVRNVGLLVRQGNVERGGGRLVHVTPNSGPNIETQQAAWTDVPGLQASITTGANDNCLTATVSGEAYGSTDRGLLLRAVIDGVAAEPSGVLFAHDRGYEGSRSMVFGACDLPPGLHNVQIQWWAQLGGTGGLGDRTLTLSSTPSGTHEPVRQFFTAEGSVVDATDTWSLMPGMSHNILIQPNSEVSVILGVEFPEQALGEVEARLVVHGTPVPDSEVLLTNEHARIGTHSFIFNAKNVHAGGIASLGPVEIEWRSVTGEGTEIRGRSMTAYVQPQAVPDLADPPPLGGVSTDGQIEPMAGERDVLVILWDPDRPEHPAPPIADLEDAFDGPTSSVADYFETISGGRFTLNVVDVLGPYASAESWSHYANGPGDHQDKWVEALEAAEDDFDFSQYDLDGDGYVHPWHELAIVIVVPQTPSPQQGSLGSVEHLWINEPGDQQTFSGVDIELIAEWYVGNPQVNYLVAAHELAHLLLYLGDLYDQSSSFDSLGIRPGRLSLMDLTPSSMTAHIDGGQKLALGWVTPHIVTQPGLYVLEDVKLSHEVLVLPRLPGSSDDEYIVLENRQDAAVNTHYDMGISDSGIAVWHLIEGQTDNDALPACTDNATWAAQAGTDDVRQGIRLLRPSVAFTNSAALWNDEHYNLDPFGLTCPGGGVAHNELRWADGTPSYSLLGFSASGQNMTVNILLP